MFNATEDEDLFSPIPTSNLASIFGTSMSLKEADTNLTYTAPKQPRISGQETPKASPKSALQSSVVCSKFVDVFQLLDKNHIAQGKCGLAIIGSESIKSYEIIVYKSKQDIIMRIKLKPDFTFTIQDNNFAYFCDDQKQQWSAHFENAKEIDYFAQQIETCGGKIAKVCNKKDTDANISTSSNISEVDIKIEKSTADIGPLAECKDKDSDSYSDTSSSHTKANILSRMAKMGQSILPANLPKHSPTQSDSETDEQQLSRKSVKKRQKQVPVKEEHIYSDAGSNQPVTMQTTPATEFVMINGQIVPITAIKQNLPAFPANLNNQLLQNIPSQLMFNQPQASPISDSLHVFIAENRTHNCEIRMNMTQLSSKLDNILEKLGKNMHTATPAAQDTSELEIELAGELEKSKTQIKAIEEEQTKLHEATANNQKIINNLNKQNEEQLVIIAEQEQKIRELENYRKILEEQNTNLQHQVGDQADFISNLKQTVTNQEAKLEHLTKFYEKNKEQQNSTAITDELNNVITDLRKQIADKNSKSDLFSRKLKQSMNLLYQQIMENFEDEAGTYQAVHVKQIVSQKLKSATFTIIQEFHNDFKDANLTQSLNSTFSGPSVPPF